MDDKAKKREENNRRIRRWYRRKRRDVRYHRQGESESSPEVQGNVHGLEPNQDQSGSKCEEEEGGQHQPIIITNSPDHETNQFEGHEEGDHVADEPIMEYDEQMNEHPAHESDHNSIGASSNLEEENMNGNALVNLNEGVPVLQADEILQNSEIETETESGESEADEELSDEEVEEGEHEGDETEDEEDEEANQKLQMPVFDGASITLQESLMAILAFSLTNSLTGLCISGLLSLIVLHCGPNNLLMKSIYKFKRHFKMIGKGFITCHYFCSVCQESLPDKDSVCTRVRTHKGIEYFIEFPILSQLRSMFSRPGFFESLQFRFNRAKNGINNIEEIYDGKIYQRCFESGFLNNPNNLSFFMYFDGISFFKSSSFSIWPIYFTINELRYKLRTKKEIL